MKLFLRNSLQQLLRKLAQLTILRYRPAIVGVTGSVGKTSAKFAITAVLASERSVRASHGNFNGEIGLPLAILGDWKKEDLRLLSRELPPGAFRFRKIWFLLKVIILSLWRLIVLYEYPEILILEYGIDRPGDMRYLISIARPNVTVLTAIGATPAHVEFFSGPDEVAKEKGKLVECLPTSGFAVLNIDDERVMRVKTRARAEIVGFGAGKEARMRILNFENRVESGRPLGVSFKLEYGGSTVPVRLTGALGFSQAYSAAAAASVGLIFGMNLVKISEALEKSYRPASHRMEIVPGMKDTWVIDDSYNASPLSMAVAMETLKSLPAKRKIAVLGDMLEIGEYAMQEHQKTGMLVPKIADELITIGPRAKFIAEGAAKAGMRKSSIQAFDVAEDARLPLRTLVKKGDLILFKASRAMHLEKLVEEVEYIGTPPEEELKEKLESAS